MFADVWYIDWFEILAFVKCSIFSLQLTVSDFTGGQEGALINVDFDSLKLICVERIKGEILAVSNGCMDIMHANCLTERNAENFQRKRLTFKLFPLKFNIMIKIISFFQFQINPPHNFSSVPTRTSFPYFIVRSKILSYNRHKYLQVETFYTIVLPSVQCNFCEWITMLRKCFFCMSLFTKKG